LNLLSEPGLAAAAKKDAALASEIKSIKSQATAALKTHRSVQQTTGSNLWYHTPSRRHCGLSIIGLPGLNQSSGANERFFIFLHNLQVIVPTETA
jgi:hypothetical protein